MAKWFKQVINNLRRKRITLTKVSRAYLVRDSKYLQKAFKLGRHYIKRYAIKYLGKIGGQSNLDFLIYAMKTTEDEGLNA